MLIFLLSLVTVSRFPFRDKPNTPNIAAMPPRLAAPIIAVGDMVVWELSAVAAVETVALSCETAGGHPAGCRGPGPSQGGGGGGGGGHPWR